MRFGEQHGISFHIFPQRQYMENKVWMVAIKEKKKNSLCQQMHCIKNLQKFILHMHTSDAEDAMQQLCA